MKRERSAAMHLPPAVPRLALGELRRHVLNPRLSWEVQRRRLDKSMRAGPSPGRHGMTVVRRELNDVPAEIVMAAGSRPRVTVVHFHGGGYCVGSASMARAWAASLSARIHGQVILPEYRLAPEHPHPAALDDARQVMKALPGEAGTTKVVLSGDSAGGGLAMSLLLSLRDEGQDLPAGCVLLSPWLDLSADRLAAPRLVRQDRLLSPGWLAACAAAYAASCDLTDPAISPLFGSLRGLPPLLIQCGSDELLAPDSRRLAASASAAGTEVTYTKWPRMWHDFALQPGVLAAADSALDQAAWFITEVLGAR
jgi:monoterpene epsilon-lactone hydrolase